MAEFYKDHTHDLDTCGKIVLDPFMGGGTTVVEALRLGCKVVGIELNPVAWFIVKTEVERVDLAELDAAFERLANRFVPWSRSPLRETLLGLYKTGPPWTVEEVCGLPECNIIYTFWVKSAVCTNSACRKQVPIFSDYTVASKSPSIRYYPDCTCPKCRKKFDWEVEPAALVGDPRLMLHSTAYSGGVGRTNIRWTYAHEDGGIYVCQGVGSTGQSPVKSGKLEKGHICCPYCAEIVKPVLHSAKKKRKKVPLTVLLCPRTEDVFQWRGEIAPGTKVMSPAGYEFDPSEGNVPEKGRFVCPHCGNNDAIIQSIRSLREDELLPTHAYAMQVYAPCCDACNDPDKPRQKEESLFESERPTTNDENEDEQEVSAPIDVTYDGPYVPPTHNLVWKQRGKFYTRHSPVDQASYQRAELLWETRRDSLPYPKSVIPSGQETDRLHEHHYRYWHQMFNPRQLLALSTLLSGVQAEPDKKLRDLLLCAFSNTLEANNTFTRNIPSRRTPGGTAPAGVFARHDFQPKATFCEQNVWGTVSGNNTYISRIQALRDGIAYARKPYDGDFDCNGKHCKREGLDPIRFDAGAELIAGDSREELPNRGLADVVITDPPYAGNVNYSELADFFYVWLRLILRREDPEFAPEYCPKTNEIIVNPSRGLDMQNFEAGLTQVLAKAAVKVSENGLVVFTFHHAEGSSWESVLNSICKAELFIEAIYPVHSEREASLHLQDNEAIAYDLIHVCRKRRPQDIATKRSWAGLRQQVRQRAREEVTRIEAGRYGRQMLPAPDVRMVLIGKCLEVYSRHYGAVMDWDGNLLPLRAALQDIRMMVEQIVTREAPLPVELETVDALSQVWLLALCDKREVSVDNISKLTRGVFEVSDLTDHKPPILRKGRVKGGRTYEVLTPLERLNGLRDALKGSGPIAEQMTLLEIEGGGKIGAEPNLVDVLHLLLANAEQGERLDHLVERFDEQRDAIRAALAYLKQCDPNRWAKACDKLLPFYSDLLAQVFTVSGGRKDGRLPGAS